MSEGTATHTAGKIEILLVEHIESSTVMLTDYLQMKDCCVTVARDDAEAVYKPIQEKPGFYPFTCENIGKRLTSG